MFISTKRLRLLFVEKKNTELYFIHKLISPYHDVDLVRDSKSAMGKIMLAEGRRYDWVIIGDLGKTVKGSRAPIDVREDLARMVQQSGIYAATVNYPDWSKPIPGQKCLVKTFDKRSGGGVTCRLIECTDGAFLNFDPDGRRVSKCTFEEVYPRIEALLAGEKVSDELMCRNWPMILGKIGIPLVAAPPKIQNPPGSKQAGLSLPTRAALVFKPKRPRQ